MSITQKQQTGESVSNTPHIRSGRRVRLKLMVTWLKQSESEVGIGR